MNVSINMKISEYLIKNFIDSCSVHKHNTEHKKNIIKLYNEVPEGAVLVKKEISKESFKDWTLKSKEK